MTAPGPFATLTDMKNAVCPFCWTDVPDLPAHTADAHPGYSRRWGDNYRLFVTAPGEAEREVPRSEINAGYRKLHRWRSDTAKSKPAARPAVPLPAASEAGPTIDGPAPAVADNARPMRIFQMRPPADVVTRGAVEAAFTREFLAETLRYGSRVVSDWDGAGEAGVFSAAESVQIASLLYDPTIGLIIDQFGGRVDHFKMFLAGVIILAGKGRVHLAAINARTRARAQTRKLAAAPAETPERTSIHEGNGHDAEANLAEDADYWAVMRERQNVAS